MYYLHSTIDVTLRFDMNKTCDYMLVTLLISIYNCTEHLLMMSRDSMEISIGF